MIVDPLPDSSNPVVSRGLPNDELASRVADALVAAGLISSSKQDEILQHLKAGTARPEDWRGWIESGWSEQR